ncbi:MAG: hypothetical protein PGN07_05935 [Aeromicrobium erythreum]
MSSVIADRPRSSSARVAVAATCLVIGALSVVGAVLGAAYALATDQVARHEALIAASVCSLVAVVFLVLPAALAIVARSDLATWWCGIVLPVVALLVAAGLYLVYVVLTLPFAALLLTLGLRWVVSTETPSSAPHPAAPAPDLAARLPEGRYTVVAMGHDYGPYTAEQLADLVREGRVTGGSTLTFDDGRPFPASELGIG